MDQILLYFCLSSGLALRWVFNHFYTSHRFQVENISISALFQVYLFSNHFKRNLFVKQDWRLINEPIYGSVINRLNHINSKLSKGTSKINSRIRKQTTICHDRIRWTINYNSKSSKILRYLHYWSFLQPRYSCQQIWKSNAHVQKLINSDINMISFIDVYTSTIILQFSVHNIHNPTTNWSAD